MSEAVQLALIASVPPTMAALAALFIGLRNSRKVQETAKKADVLIEKTVEIHTLANSNLSKTTASLEVANAKIDGLQAQIAQMVSSKDTADKLASDKVAVKPASTEPCG